MIFLSKKEFASYFEGRIFGIYFSFKTTFHKQVLYSSKTLNKLSCHHLFVPTQPYPRFAYFRPKPGAADNGAILTRRTQNRLHPFRFRTPAICTVRTDFVRRACCHVSAFGTFCRQNDIRFLYPILHQLEEKSGFSAHFYPVWLPNVPLHAEKNQDFCGEKKCFLSRMKNFLLHKNRRKGGKCAQSGVYFKVGNKNINLLTAI